jgi:hypothetical protein
MYSIVFYFGQFLQIEQLVRMVLKYFFFEKSLLWRRRRILAPAVKIFLLLRQQVGPVKCLG